MQRIRGAGPTKRDPQRAQAGDNFPKKWQFALVTQSRIEHAKRAYVLASTHFQRRRGGWHKIPDAEQQLRSIKPFIVLYFVFDFVVITPIT
ncbi:hypothetical protein EOA13_17405 [Mesorhizobium sp. M7A.F.Ca.US.011.01.1.1]|jgi:hypothetical protein|uniref:hypothetical protein n=1 Tax=Mesorhizobium sp. M7A.F.Ca.US.011.01.1.1 TaxID=2496741 RepID=UPI000FCB2D8D|nr:hypothetical protein [Mesorhizobium sp. M7A.F.Ca.US.011.01.1.1]RUX28381.1 hypothetical protein EOA13_17405 [Mesorhizobium sp. M7A.F.Ca.US.011.01.1.1]